MNRHELTKKVRTAIDQLVYEKGYASPVELFMKLGKLSKQDYESWRKRKVSYLERVMQGSLKQLSFIMKVARGHAEKRGLKSSWTAYKSWGKGKKIMLTFSKSRNPTIEKAYATHFVDTNRIKKKG